MLTEDSAHVDLVRDDVLTTDEVPALLALNHDLRREYSPTDENGLKRWNRVLSRPGSPAVSRCRTSAATVTSGCFVTTTYPEG